MKKIFIVMLAVCSTVQAFDYDACVEVSQAEPHNMSPERARTVCDAKRGESGTSDTARSNRNFAAVQGNASIDLKRELDTGLIVVETCVGTCTKEHKISCPSGYSRLENSMGRAYYGAYHGRYPIRSGLCARD